MALIYAESTNELDTVLQLITDLKNNVQLEIDALDAAWEMHKNVFLLLINRINNPLWMPWLPRKGNNAMNATRRTRKWKVRREIFRSQPTTSIGCSRDRVSIIREFQF